MKLDTSIIQEQSFTETCLPVTMRIAESNMRFALKNLTAYPNKWSFADKVLAWLAPEFKNHLTDYYNSNGQPMENLFKEHQIEHLDDIYSQILKSKLEAGSCVRDPHLTL